MLSEEDLNAVGPSSLALHNHYMECHFGSDADTFPVQFSDLYDLFNLDALDISLLQCFSFALGQYMLTKGATTKSKATPKLTHKTDFKCPQQLSGSNLCGFHVAFNMMTLIGDGKTYKISTDFTAPPISKDSYVMIPEMISNFILRNVIPPEGRYYVHTTVH
ncbi:hypothetical protein C2845_PM03G33630 [Panicum miliaceum]|uniref:Ubiquitin-like protease family profile domain-containing protein n=1 Tax=Panicum miliaceum TaxID=4540 RepID=A0A3L6T8P7_PANMI|nr:hypothetical protein C2845_PM03G33630 [Panicum miliaceum]